MPTKLAITTWVDDHPIVAHEQQRRRLSIQRGHRVPRHDGRTDTLPLTCAHLHSDAYTHTCA